MNSSRSKLGLLVVALCAALSAGAGYTRMDFMTCTGANMVDTGYVPACTDRIEMKVRFVNCSTTAAQTLFCTRGANNANQIVAFFYKTTAGHQILYYRKSSKQVFSEKVFTDADTGTDFVIALDGSQVKGFVDDASVTLDTTVTDFTPTARLSLFASQANMSGGGNYAYYRFYYCRIYDKDGKLVREFVPARDDSQVDGAVLQCGVWDTVTETFHANLKTKAFDLTGATEVGPLAVSKYWTWTGQAGTSDLTDAANWCCTNAAGEVVETGVPGTDATVRLVGTDLALTLPAAAYAGVRLGDCTLAADLDLLSQNDVQVEGTVNLKGHKLYLNRLAGGGTVTDDTAFDLTTADASKVSCSTTFYYSDIKASNLFNDVTPFNGANNSKRVIMSKKNLPMVVDYDFGEPTAIDAYRVWEGSLAGSNLNRAPTAWTLAGSNDGTTWTTLDSREEVYWPSSCAMGRVLSLDAPATNRLYRLTVTDCPDTDAGFMTLIQLEYGRQSALGELHLNVPANQTVQNTEVAITGQVRVIKEGAGLYVPAKAGQSNWSLTVQAGTVRLAASDSSSRYLAQTGGEIRIDSGTVFDLYGMAGFDFTTFVLNGGTLKNTVRPTVDPWQNPQIKMLCLNADSAVRFYYGSFMATGSMGQTIDLRGHTLSATATATSYFTYTHVTAGTLQLYGPWQVNGRPFSAPETSVEMYGRLYCSSSATMGDYLEKATDKSAYLGSGSFTNTLTVTRRFQPTTEYFYGCTLTDGATLDLTAQTNTWNTSSKITGTVRTNVTFAADATITVDVHGRDFSKASKKLVTWHDTLQPANYGTLTFVLDAVTSARGYALTKQDDGLYLVKGLIIILR